LSLGSERIGRHRRPILFTLVLIALTQSVTAALGQSTQAGAVVVEDRAVITLRAPVGSISPAERAAIVNGRIERILGSPDLRPELLEVRTGADGSLLLAAGEFPLVEVTAGDAIAEGVSQADLAERWKLALRQPLVEMKPLHRPHRKEPRISFLPLLVVALLAFLVPLFATRLGRLRLPVVVGEILVGILIGRSGLGLVHYDSWLQFLAEFGFAFLMFLSGLEVDFNILRAAQPGGSNGSQRHSWKQNPTVIAAATFVLTLALAAAVSFALSAARLIERPWLMILVLSTTSLGMVVPMLKERGAIGTRFGQTVLLSALVADFVTMLLITLVAGLLSSGPTLRLFLVLFLLAAFAAAVRLSSWASRSERILKAVGEASRGTAQVPVRGSLALMLIFVALSEQLGTEVILGAFLAGLLLSLLIRSEGIELRHKLEALGFGFFIPVFFIMVGVRFDLSAIVARPEGLLLAFWLVVGAFAIKFCAVLPFRWLVSWRETLAAGALMSSRLSLIIAAAEIGLRLGLFSETVHAGAVCVALVTCVVGPMGFEALMPKDQQTGKSGSIGREDLPGTTAGEVTPGLPTIPSKPFLDVPSSITPLAPRLAPSSGPLAEEPTGMG